MGLWDGMGWDGMGWYRAGVLVAYSTCPVWHRLLFVSTPGRVDACDGMRWVAGWISRVSCCIVAILYCIVSCDGSPKAKEATLCTVREIVCITRVEFVIGIIGMMEIAIAMPRHLS